MLSPIPRHTALINTDATPTMGAIFTLAIRQSLDYHFLSRAHHKSTRIQLFPSHVCGHLGFLGAWPVEKCSIGFQQLKVQSLKKKSY